MISSHWPPAVMSPCTAKATCRIATAGNRLCLRRSRCAVAPGAASSTGRRPRLWRDFRQGLCGGTRRCRRLGPPAEARNLGSNQRHKKRGKSRRYLGRCGAFRGGRGRVLSVRQAGAVTYVNFGRRWTEDFAVTVSRRMIAAFETAGIMLKSLERRHIRVRGWIERRGGPRIEALGVWQIEVVGDK